MLHLRWFAEMDAVPDILPDGGVEGDNPPDGSGSTATTGTTMPSVLDKIGVEPYLRDRPRRYARGTARATVRDHSRTVGDRVRSCR